MLSSFAQKVASAHLMYMQDYDERFCPAVVDNPDSEPPSGTDYPASWQRLLEPYGASDFNAPYRVYSDRSPKETRKIRFWGMPMRWRFYSGRDASADNLWATPFGAAMMDGVGGYHRMGNSNYFGEGPARFCGQRRGNLRPRFLPSYTLADIARPAETALVLEALSFEYGMTCRLPVPAPRDATDQTSYYHGLNFRNRTANRHGFWYGSWEGVVIFTDGSCKRMKPEQLFAIRTGVNNVPFYTFQYVRE